MSNQTPIHPESEPSPDEKPSRASELCNEIEDKLTQAIGVLRLIRESELIRDRKNNSPYRGIADAVWVVRDLVDAAENAFVELQQIEQPWDGE